MESLEGSTRLSPVESSLLPVVTFVNIKMATTATATATDDSLEEMELPGMDLAKLEDLCPLPPTVKQEPTEAADSPTAPAASSIPTQTSNSASTSAGVAAAAAAANTGIQPVAVLSATTPLLAPPIAAAVAAVPSSSSAITPQNNTASIGNNKSKKKKVPCATTTGISAANALASSAAGGAAGSLGNQGENTGRWTAEEHRLFLQGLEQHGKGWKKIASLIKSRTVVQIRTHAQKYFQKLAKARQNGDDEHAVTFMEGRGGGGPSSITSASTILVAPRRRRQITGTKRKVIQSIVASAHRQGKKATTTTKTAGLESLSTTTAADNTTVLPTSMGVPNPFAVSISPLLSYFVLPSSTSNEGGTEENISPGSISNAALEDSLYVPFVFINHINVAALLFASSIIAYRFVSILILAFDF